MNLSVGLVGFPNVGKSTLFNALLGRVVADASNYPFCTIEPNVGIVEVKDKRLEILKKITEETEGLDNGFKLIPAVVEFVDIAGLVQGASTGEGLGNKFLSHIREVDAIALVLRDFADNNVIRSGSTTPKDDKEILMAELAIKDLETVTEAIAKLAAKTKSPAFTKDEREKLTILEKVQVNLNQGNSAILGLNDEEKLAIKEFSLLTAKPVIEVINCDEADLNKPLEANQIRLCAKTEFELTELSEEEREMFREDWANLEGVGLDALINKAYEVLGYISFFTAGPKEVRAWTIPNGATAPQAAGVIHTDFEKKFIRADVVSYDSFVECHGYLGCKEKGKSRMEGRDYIVSDGDLMIFHHS